MKQVPNEEPGEECHLLSRGSDDDPVVTPAVINKANVVLLFAAAMLYSSAVGGAVEMLGVFVMKEPLSWSATQVTFCSLYVF